MKPSQEQYDEADRYIDPATGVLRNLLGVDDAVALEQAEADFSAVRLAQLQRRDLPGGYDLEHLCGFHHAIFGDLYPWAGELRTVWIAKGAPFCMPAHIRSSAAEIFTRLERRDHLRGLDSEEFTGRLTGLLGDLNELHPFRDGNGRTQRAFCSQLARHAGHRLRWAPMDPAENVSASRTSLHGDNTPLHTMLVRLVDRPDPGSTAPLSGRPVEPGA